MNYEHIIIIGGGVGGLFTGAILAHEGFRVTVLEKNGVIGGGLQEFSRGGVSFETGMHMLGGLRAGGSIRRILEWLGLWDKIHVRPVDADCMDSVTYLRSGDVYRIPEGREAFTAYLCERFPHEADGIQKYVAALYELAQEVDLFWLRPSGTAIPTHSEAFLLPVDELIARYVDDFKLRELLAYVNPMYGGVKGHTPAYIHALISVLYIEGTDRFEGGSLQLANALRDVIEQGGGAVLPAKRVAQIHVADRIVTSVETTDGERYTADKYISAIHPQALFPLLESGAFSPAYCRRVSDAPNSYSAFTLYLIFKPESFPYINHTCYYQEDYGYVWKLANYDPADWPRGFMYMTSADTDQGAWASKMIVNCIMPFSVVAEWAENGRDSRYKQWKSERVAQVMARLEQLHPGITGSVARIEASSPLTIRDFYNQPEGALYGMRKDCRNILGSQLNVFTRVRNLYLTGQNINLHGFCGTPLTAINTAEALLGQNYIVNAINGMNK